MTWHHHHHRQNLYYDHPGDEPDQLKGKQHHKLSKQEKDSATLQDGPLRIDKLNLFLFLLQIYIDEWCLLYFGQMIQFDLLQFYLGSALMNGVDFKFKKVCSRAKSMFYGNNSILAGIIFNSDPRAIFCLQKIGLCEKYQDWVVALEMDSGNFWGSFGEDLCNRPKRGEINQVKYKYPRWLPLETVI